MSNGKLIVIDMAQMRLMLTMAYPSDSHEIF